MRYLAAILAVVVFSGCGREESRPAPSPAQPPPSKAERPPAIEDSPRNEGIIGSINEIGREQFPDNAQNTWTIRAIDHDGDMAYVEAVPSPDDVGYPSFVFALHFKADRSSRCVAVYCMEKGKYTLLGSVADFDGPLPNER